MSEISPLYSTARILRPFSGFERVYQGKSAAFPIAMPGGLDFEAINPDYDPGLLDMIPVPMGSRIYLWIPLTFTSDTENPDPVVVYSYQIIWRLRNIEEANESADFPDDQKKLYSIRNRTQGVPAVGTTPRVLVPCAMDTVAYEQQEPATSYTNATVNLRGYTVIPTGAVFQNSPLLPSGGFGAFGQGNTGAAVAGNSASGPGWMAFETIAKGNEMAIVAQRATVGLGAKWDFTSNTADQPFSNVYGTDNGHHAEIPGMGIQVITGTP